MAEKCELSTVLSEFTSHLDSKVLVSEVGQGVLHLVKQILKDLITPEVVKAADSKLRTDLFDLKASVCKLVQKCRQYIESCKLLGEFASHNDLIEAVVSDLNAGDKSVLETYLQQVNAHLKNMQETYEDFENEYPLAKECIESKKSAYSDSKDSAKKRQEEYSERATDSALSGAKLGALGTISCRVGTMLRSPAVTDAIEIYVPRALHSLSNRCLVQSADEVASAIQTITKTVAKGAPITSAALIAFGGITLLVSAYKLYKAGSAAQDAVVQWQLANIFERAETVTEKFYTTLENAKISVDHLKGRLGGSEKTTKRIITHQCSTNHLLFELKTLQSQMRAFAEEAGRQLQFLDTSLAELDKLRWQ